MKLIIGFIVLIFLIVLAKAADDDACTFKAQTCYTASQVKKCVDLFPLDKEKKAVMLDQFKKAMQIHPLTDVFSKVGVNIFDNLRKIARRKYKNEFDFHKDLFLKITQNVPDFSTGYALPNGFFRFRLERPFILTPKGSTEHFTITKINPHYTIPADVIGKEVVSVDGVSVADYIKNRFFFNGQDSQQFMNNYLFQAYDIRPVQFGIPSKDSSTFTFADGSTLDVDNCIYVRQDLNFTAIQTFNLPYSPSPNNKRSEEAYERCINKIGVCFDAPISFEPVHVEKRDAKEGKPALVKFEDSTDSLVQRGIVQHDGNKLPFLRLVSFDKSDKTWKQVILNFVKQLSKTQAPLAIIDLTQYNFGGDICEAEWIINLLSQTNTQPFQKDTYKTNTYRTLLDSRVSNKLGRFAFSHFYPASIIDPTSGLPFEDSFCPTEKLNKLNRVNSKQLFTPKFYQDNQCKDFIKPYKFPTKFLILSNTNCAGVCSVFQTVLRKTGVAKIVGVGGLDKSPLSVNFAYYGGVAYDWSNDIAPIFPLADGIKPLPTNASLTISLVESYLSDSRLPEAVINLYSDEVIGWDKYTSPINDVVVPSPAIDLYVLASNIDPKVEKVELPAFKPKSKCYSERKEKKEQH